MKTPLILFSLSLCVVAGAFVPGSPFGEEALHYGLLSATAAFVLLLLAALKEDPVAPRRVTALSTGKAVMVDGSNVMYWATEKPDLSAVKLVVQDLQRQGFTPTVWFDANVGYLTHGRYLGAKDLARPIGLPRGSVNIAPRGTPADPLILQSAQKLKVPVVSNDRFRDWSETYPYLTQPGVLVPGQIARGLVSLSLN